MDISTNALYVLVEGTPNSPETTFFREFPFPDDKIRLIFVEVGGSGSFNIIAELIYNQIQSRKKSIHPDGVTKGEKSMCRRDSEDLE